MTMSPKPLPPPSMELLAPAGTVPACEAAFAAGADAVYVGAPGLNARALARDFTFAEIAAMIQHARGLGKKLYVALNSVVKEEELPLALATLAQLDQLRPDALIVQDLGVVHLVRRFFPGLELHASTLMTVTSAAAADYFRQLGFTRVVLARELSLEAIKAIHHHSPIDLEIFVHGAMCFSYSGLCRFSSLHGGKSSLRGQCVQPCRRRYAWLPSGKRAMAGATVKGGEFFFSMNDLCGIDHLAAIRDAGVVSLKIEGRLRSVAYVRNTVQAYRLALDTLGAPADRRAQALGEAQRLLGGSMGRKRSTGFLIAGQEERAITPRLTGSTGEVVGKVRQLELGRETRTGQNASLQVALQAPVRVGDRLRLYEERHDIRLSFTLRTMTLQGRPVPQAESGQVVTMALGELPAGRLKPPCLGTLFRVDVGERTEAAGSSLVRRAARLSVSAPDPARLSAMLKVLGVDTAEPSANPAPRRSPGRPRSGSGRSGHGQGMQWWLQVAGLEALTLRYPFKIAKVVLPLTSDQVAIYQQYRRRLSTVAPLVWSLPPVIEDPQLHQVQELLRRVLGLGCTEFQLSHIGHIGLFSTVQHEVPAEGLQLYGDHACNVFNSATLQMYAACGLRGVQWSMEVDQPTMAAGLNHYFRSLNESTERIAVGCTVYSRPALFTAKLDAPHFKGQRSFASPHGERYYLDRRNETLCAYSHTPFSLLDEVATLSRMGVEYLVVDVRHGSPKKTAAEVTALLTGRGEVPPHSSGNFSGKLS